MADFTYEAAVHWLRSQPEHRQLLKDSYLDDDNLAAARRFARSEEFGEVSELLSLGVTQRPLKILDVSCGNGIAAYAFASLGNQVAAVDPDESADVGIKAAARLASALSRGSLSVYEAAAEDLPFVDSSFDIVYARQALHHFGDLQKGVAECARVLKPGGVLFATREHVVENDGQLRQFLAEHPLHRLHGGENAYSEQHYKSMFQRNGLRISKSFATFETIINHFPSSNEQVRGEILKAVFPKYGWSVWSRLLKFPSLENLCRRWYSKLNKFPGMLFSFLCVKQD